MILKGLHLMKITSFFSKTIVGVTLVVIILAVIISLQLESWVKSYANTQINALEGYSGGIDDVDLDLWRGGYKIIGLQLNKDEGGLKEKFVSIKSADFSVRWRDLIYGKIVAEVELNKPEVNFAKTQTGEGTDWLTLLKSLTPFDLTRFTVNNGRLDYIDYVAEPNIHLFIKDLDVILTNISNVKNKKVALPSDIYVRGTTLGGGALSVKGGMNILKDIPDFDIAAEFTNANLTYFNDYFINYASLDFTKGTVSVFSEIAAVNGKMTGYIKPIASDLDMVSLKQDSNPLNFIWESIAGFFLETLQNQPKDQFAMRIPLNGDLTAPDQEIWSGIFSIFNNAFVDAFKKDVDGSINLKDAMKQGNEVEQE